jgi:hypothetical protein
LLSNLEKIMHEMGIANSILEAAHKELHGYPRHRVSKIGLRIGEFAGVDIESLKFCLEAVAKSENLGSPALEIESCSPGHGRRGDELQIAYFELEEDAMETMEAQT